MDNQSIPTKSNEQFTCDICGEKFETVTALEEHTFRHRHPKTGLEDTQRGIRGDIGAAGLPTSPVQ